MRILVVGSGGREHALVWRLSQEAEVFAAPGNPGIAEIAECFDVSAMDLDGIVKLAQGLDVDYVVVGPEDPLIAGLGDRLRAAGIAVTGPDASGAALEGSKALSKEVMARAGVPTAAFQTFTDLTAARLYTLGRFDSGRQVAVKASGAALGKGVVVCSTFDEADEALTMMLDRGELGDAGKTVVVEDRLMGREFSLLTLVSEDSYLSLPVSQDHKRIFDHDQGPNTGGMGTCSPVAWLDPALIRETELRVVEPTIQAMKAAGTPYRGILFSGLLVEGDTPYCLEFNVRFGDPETQTLMPMLGEGFAASLADVANGRSITPMAPNRVHASISVVLASGGYPGPVEKGRLITIGPLPDGVTLFHAGTKLVDGKLVTNGGRVLAVNAVGSTLQEARDLAYEGVKQVSFDGMQFRSDIGS